ncbi:MAG TPA: hypothetical protein VIW92_15610 [Thermoanaerobaculia bacterium]
MPESLRKRRQRERRTREEELVESVRRLASTQAGVTVEANPASDFETLGFNVHVPPQLTDAEIVDLGNQLLEVATASALKGESSWTWMIGIYRAGVLVTVITAGDGRNQICSLCGFIQQESMGDRCLSCKSNLLP